MSESSELSTVSSTIITDVAQSIDFSERRDLRLRLADGLAEWIDKNEDQSRHQLLPSVRHLSDAFGIHRATVQAAVELLVERSVLARTPSGRYVTAAPSPEDAAQSQSQAQAPTNFDTLMAAAADAALAGGMSESDFTTLAGQSFRARAIGEMRVVYVDTGTRLRGISASELSRLLNHPVSTESLAAVRPAPNTTFVAHVSGVAEVRAKLAGVADVFAIGVTLETDLKIAVADLSVGARLTLVAEDRSMLASIEKSLSAIRPDLSVEGHLELPAEVSTSLALVPEDAVVATDAPVARYRSTISIAELIFLRARLANAQQAWVQSAVPTAENTDDFQEQL